MQGVTKTVTAVNSHGKFLEVKTPRPDRYWQSNLMLSNPEGIIA
ncbi:MAG: hypothetical protein PHG79_02545 [Methanosarcina sp.]|nr:hypothetical protein [Methanosarcina sp.]MDD3873477.1 hypothetical protein [Methanosarcina sp.]MDD4521612.1 hypothetical protein [Methanosarcina sp.]